MWPSNTKHKYSLERNNQSLQKYLDNATPEYRLKILTKDIAHPILNQIIHYFGHKKHNENLELNQQMGEDSCMQLLNTVYEQAVKDFKDGNGFEFEGDLNDFLEILRENVQISEIPADVKKCFETNSFWETSKNVFLSDQVMKCLYTMVHYIKSWHI